MRHKVRRVFLSFCARSASLQFACGFFGGVAELSALGTWMASSLALAADLQRRQSTAKTLLPILPLALSLWVHFVTGYYIAAIVVATLIGMIRRRRPSLAQSAAPAARPGTLALVMLASLVMLFLLASVPSTSDFLHCLTGIVTIAFPVLLGALQPSTSDTLFASQLAEKSVIHALGVGLCVIVCLAILWVGMQRAKRGDNLLFLFAAMTVLVFSLVFTALRDSFILLQEPRYLLPLYSAVPLDILAVYQLTQKVTGLRIVLLGGLLVFNLFRSGASLRRPPGRTTYRIRHRMDYDLRFALESEQASSLWTGALGFHMHTPDDPARSAGWLDCQVMPFDH